MKRNWIIITAIIGALIAYDLYVLRPFNKKNTIVKKTEAPVSQVETVVTDTNTQAAPTTINLQNTTQPKEIVKVETLPLGEKRSAELFSDGSISKVIFNDYFQRGKDSNIPIQLGQGLSWSSTHPGVRACLNSFIYQGNFRFFGKEQGIECELLYLPKSELAGKLDIKLSLKGIEGAQGIVALELKDSVGVEDQLDLKSIVYKINSEKEKLSGDKLLETQVRRGTIDWFTWGDKYFTTSIIPVGGYNPDLAIQPLNATTKEKKDRTFQVSFQYPLVSIGGAPQKIDIQGYIGTRDIESMRAIKADLVNSIEMGWFSSVGRFMLWSLEKLNLFFHNFGVSIIVLTLLVRILFWPLNKRVFQSGQKMKDIQPKVEALKKKYGDDKSKMAQMNQEMMALYKQEKVNPAGSCLPLLLQMPIFIGLYGCLNNSIDLYQASFVFWIKDLSYKDPYYVLPIAWTLSMLAMMKYTPQPTQQQPGMPDMKKVMFVMYIVFGFMAKNWPSGLCLYLVVSSVVGTLQQMLFQRSHGTLKTVQEGV